MGDTYFPILVDLDGQPCIVIGGGEIALRKTEGLLNSGARVTVISPDLVEGLIELKKNRKIKPKGT